MRPIFAMRFEAHFGFKHTPFTRELPLESLIARRPTENCSAGSPLLPSAGRDARNRRGGRRKIDRPEAAERPTRSNTLRSDLPCPPGLHAAQILQALLEVLHLEMPFQTGKAKATAQQALLERFRIQRRTPVLLIDEAQVLPNPLFELVRTLLNYDCDAFSPFALVLAGTIIKIRPGA